MAKNHYTWILIFFLLMPAALATAGEPAAPWARLSEASQLNDRQKDLVTDLLGELNSYYGCSDTLLVCLTEEETDSPEGEAALRQAGFVIRRALEGKTRNQIEDAFKAREVSAFPPRRVNIDVSGLAPGGKPAATVRVVVYADFECPYCNIAMPALRKLAAESPVDIVLYFKNFPVKTHPRSVDAAKALLAAEKQGKFWEMLDIMYANNESLSIMDISRYAREMGLDVRKLRSEMNDTDVVSRIRSEKLEGLRLGVEGTPGIFINGKLYRGPKTYPELKDRIEEELHILQEME